MWCGAEGVVDAAPANEIGHTPAYDGNGPWFTCDPRGEMPPRLAEHGCASSDGAEPLTMAEMLTRAAKKKPAASALRVERPSDASKVDIPVVDGKPGKPPPAMPADEWTAWTYQEYLNDVRSAARGLMAFGVQQFDSVNVWGFNAPEWQMSAYAAAFAGAKVAGIYPSDIVETVAYKIVHSGGSAVVVEDRGKLKKIVEGLNASEVKASRVKVIVGYDFEPAEGETVNIEGCGAVPVVSWKALLAKGSGDEVSDAALDERVALIKPGHCAALIYTSGTTGMPKAVMISHDNVAYMSQGVLQTLRTSAGVGTGGDERMLSYLPLSHVAGMMLDICCPVATTFSTESHMTVYFARNYDLKAGTLKDRLNAAKPTIFLGVPLVWEKIADKIRAIGAETKGLKKTIATWAKGCGLSYAKEAQLGGSGAKPFGYGLANSLVLSKIAANLGLDELKFGLTGAAPIRVDTLEYFGQLGIEINEVYGMSESCGLATLSTHQVHMWGSCGYELPGLELKAFKVDPTDMNKKEPVPAAPDLNSAEEEFMGELCWRSRGNMMGYMANPDLGEEHVAEMQKKTAEAIDNEGWLHSGDKGLVTNKGMVKITGRYKELIIGEGGENIAPVPIEDRVKKNCDGLAEVMMIGDKRKYNVCFVTLKAVGANGEVPGTDDLDAGAARVNPDVKTISAAMDDAAWIKTVQDAIVEANNSKLCQNNAFKIQKFMILPSNFSEQNQELTPTKKLKRKVVEDKYKQMVDRMYAADQKGPYVRYEA